MRYKIIIATGKTNYKGNRYRTFNLAFSDTAAYPFPTTVFSNRFRELYSNVHTCLLWSSLPTITLVIVLAIVIAIAITIVIVAVVAAALVIII